MSQGTLFEGAIDRAETKAERNRRYQKTFRERHPDRRRELARRWRERNLDKCRASQKAWNARNPDKIREFRKRHAPGTFKRRRAIIDEIKLAAGCKMCGYNKCAAALEFDHRDPLTKSFAVGAGILKSMKRLLDEIKKCDVLCANCHREKSVRDADHMVGIRRRRAAQVRP